MKISNGEKSIEIRMDSYEFPFHETTTFHDNNWLNVKAICEDEVLVEEGVSACLLSQELVSMYDGLTQVLMGSSYQSDFIEHDLFIKANPNEKGFEVTISFHLPNAFVFEVNAFMTKKQFEEMVSDVKAMSECFPIRNTKG